MLNFTGLAKAPEWRVELHRKQTLNDAQNARSKVEYVIATDCDHAKTLAAKRNPAFVAVIARRKA